MPEPQEKTYIDQNTLLGALRTGTTTIVTPPVSPVPGHPQHQSPLERLTDIEIRNLEITSIVTSTLRQTAIQSSEEPATSPTTHYLCGSPQIERTGNKTSRNPNRRRADASRGPFLRRMPFLTSRLVPTTSTHHPNHEEGCALTQGRTSSTHTMPTTSRLPGHQRPSRMTPTTVTHRAQGHRHPPSLVHTRAAQTAKPDDVDLAP